MKGNLKREVILAPPPSFRVLNRFSISNSASPFRVFKSGNRRVVTLGRISLGQMCRRLIAEYTFCPLHIKDRHPFSKAKNE